MVTSDIYDYVYQCCKYVSRYAKTPEDEALADAIDALMGVAFMSIPDLTQKFDEHLSAKQMLRHAIELLDE